MQPIVTQLQAIILPVVSGLGYELVGLEYLPQGKQHLLRLYIDHPNGITVEDCARVSHQVSAVLAIEQPLAGEGPLEVSSPGLDRPLFTLAHFVRFTGRQVKISLMMPMNGQRRYQGLLVGVEGELIQLLVDNKPVQLAWSNIQRARLVPQF